MSVWQFVCWRLGQLLTTSTCQISLWSGLRICDPTAAVSTGSKLCGTAWKRTWMRGRLRGRAGGRAGPWSDADRPAIPPGFHVDPNSSPTHLTHSSCCCCCCMAVPTFRIPSEARFVVRQRGEGVLIMGFWDGSGISWTICKQSPPPSRQITTPTPHHSIFTGRILFLTPNQQCQAVGVHTARYK